MNEAEKILHAHGIKLRILSARPVLHDLPTMLGEAQQGAPTNQMPRREDRSQRACHLALQSL